MEESKEVRQIPIEDIIPNRFQPRINFDEKALNELADSIKQHGIIQPLVLRPLGDKFEIIAGERRYKAATLAGLSTVPGIVTEMDDNTSAEVALIENVQRKDLSSIEEAKSYKSMLERSNMTQEELAKKMGLSQSTIANKLRLLNLSQEVQDALSQEKISERHARALLSITNKEEQVKWLDRIIKERLTVRQLDLAIKDELNDNIEPSGDDVPKVNINPDIESIINNAVDINGTTNPISNDSNNILGDNSFQPENEKHDNKFFNYLEDQEVNMSTTEEPKPVDNTNAFTGVFEFTPEFQNAPENEFKPDASEEIETLDDLEVSNTETVSEQIKPAEEPIFNENTIQTEKVNSDITTTEPINNVIDENVVAPISQESVTGENVISPEQVVQEQPIIANVETPVVETPVSPEPEVVENMVSPSANATEVINEPIVQEQPAIVNPVENTAAPEVAPAVPDLTINTNTENNEVEEFIFDDEDEEPSQEVSSVSDEPVKVEPIPIMEGEGVVDPVSYYDTLDPGFVDKVKEFIGLDLKNAINSYRELTQDLNSKGFNVTIDETDLDNKYYIEINISKE